MQQINFTTHQGILLKFSTQNFSPNQKFDENQKSKINK